MDFQEMNLQEFARWLRDLPSDTTFKVFPYTENCPVARHCGQRAAAWIYGMPRWASEFIDAFDAQPDGTHADALAALATVEARFDVSALG